MSTAFSRTVRSLQGDRFGVSNAAIAVVLILLVGWAAWFFGAELSVYAVSERARLEVDNEAHPVEARVSGQVVATALELGRIVQEGDVLVELDADPMRLQLREREAERDGLRRQILALETELEAQRQALKEAREAAGSALLEAKARHDEAKAASALAAAEASQLERLHGEGLVSNQERDRAAAEAEQKRASADAIERNVDSLMSDRRYEQSEKRARIAELTRDAEELAARLRSLDAVIERLQYELEQHFVRAPVSGELGEVVPLAVGTVVSAGDQLAAVVPSGEIRVVAELSPPQALGRVRPGQRALLRLTGFPWVQYGAVPAVVTRVATETQNGRIRVELGIDRESPAFPVPLQHGLPGTIEIAVERATPATLVLRAAGMLVSRPTGSSMEPIETSGSNPASR